MLMDKFINKNFLLNTDSAKKLYHEYAADIPIIDYHCHIDPKEIYEDRVYPNITQLWLGTGNSYFGDHYKWRLMRSFGIDEEYITGSKPDEERFVKWAECLGKAIGNPLYHWSHMELKKYFGFDGILNGDNAREVYSLCNEKMKASDFSVRGLIEQSNVKLICTTDDPADSLIWHQKLAKDVGFGTKVLPAMRPDKAKNIQDKNYLAYLKTLGKAAGIEIRTFMDLKNAILKRMDFFETLGCKVSDHALTYIVYKPAPEEEIEKIFAERLKGIIPDETRCEKFYTAFMLFVSREYARREWVMQIHFGCRRNNNTRMYIKMGADTGFDCIASGDSVGKITDFLDHLNETGELPKTILYSLNPNDDSIIDSVIGCYQDASVCGKLQHGSAWWFNDHYEGMRNQMKSLASQGALASFVGMLTDSRSFLSYTRHEYFRRILCGLFGEWIEAGMYPKDWDTLGKIVKNICYNNAVTYFNFPLDRI